MHAAISCRRFGEVGRVSELPMVVGAMCMGDGVSGSDCRIVDMKCVLMGRYRPR